MENSKIKYSHERGIIMKGNKKIHLTLSENILFNMLLHNKIVKAEEMLTQLYGDNKDCYGKEVIVQKIFRLRYKLEGIYEITNIYRLWIYYV